MPEAKFMDGEYRAYWSAPVLQATNERGHLTPVIGAGLSRGIGLPSWQELSAAVTATLPEANTRSSDMSASLLTASQRLSKAAYEKLIQTHLDTPENKTSLAHQALVAAGVQRIITTNLDFGIERAFEMAGTPLRPENVLIGASRTRRAVRSGTTLHKVHGSLEEPSSWVLRSDEYDRAYLGAEVSQWWQGIADPLLFIGFSFSDEDINHSLRVMEVQRRVGNYAILHLRDVREKSDKLRAAGVTPIAYLDIRQIPELIDEIFRGATVRTVLASDVFSNTRQLRIGAAHVDIPDYFSPEDVKEVGQALAIALEFGAPDASLDSQSRRKYGERGQFIGTLQKWVTATARQSELSQDANLGEDSTMEKWTILLRGLLPYPDVLFTQLLPGVIPSSKINARILKVIWQHGDEWVKTRLLRYCLNLLEHPYLEEGEKMLDSSAIRGIAVVVADTMQAHPAMKMPPLVVDVPGLPNLRFSKYALTVSQVAKLKGTTQPVDDPIKPHTLSSRGEATEIVKALNTRYSSMGTWRLPTDEEWEQMYATSGFKWPWGDNDPVRGVHAHLKFAAAGGSIAHHPLEVGTYAGDIASRFPLRDVVGNVYEWVDRADHSGPALAGGSWTTVFRGSGKPTIISTFEASHVPQENIGVRVVLVPHQGD